jgi:ferredoxin
MHPVVCRGGDPAHRRQGPAGHDALCDGLGNCLGECPQGAIRITNRVAAAYDEQQVVSHLQQLREQQPRPEVPLRSGCPGSTSRMFAQVVEPAASSTEGVRLRSRLRNWPIELMLVPEQAPYYEGADLLISADCVPFADPSFHTDLLEGRVLMIACPKLDNTPHYLDKLERIFSLNNVASVTWHSGSPAASTGSCGAAGDPAFWQRDRCLGGADRHPGWVGQRVQAGRAAVLTAQASPDPCRARHISFCSPRIGQTITSKVLNRCRTSPCGRQTAGRRVALPPGWHWCWR